MTVEPISAEERERVKELLAKATPGPWQVYRQPIGSRDDAIYELSEQIKATEPFVDTLFLLSAIVGDKSLCPATSGCGPTSEANAALIAEARTVFPAYEAALQAAEDELATCCTVRDSAVAALEAAEAKIEELREALTWYGNKDNHTLNGNGTTAVRIDGGTRARAALEGSKDNG